MRRVETDNIEDYNRIPGAIRVSKTEVVLIEDLIVKVAIANEIIGSMHEKIKYLDAISGDCGACMVDGWAIRGVSQGLDDVVGALKCGLYGYGHAYDHD
jgi:hypothetical protein